MILTQGVGRPTSRLALVQTLLLPRNIAILCNYLALGLLLKLPYVALREKLRGELAAEPSMQSLVLGVIMSLPWSLKIPIAFLSDVVPLCGMRRKPYMLIGSILCAAAWLALGSGVDRSSLGHFGALTFLATLGMLVCDVMADAVVVERMRELESEATKGTIQTACWVARFTGSILGLIGGGQFLTRRMLTPRGVFTLTGLVPLVLVVPPLVLLVDARDTTTGMSIVSGEGVVATARARAKLIWSTVSLVSVWQPMLFVFCYAAMPRSTDAFANFLLGPLGFSDAAYSEILAAGYLAQMGGSLLYSSVLSRMERRRMFALVIVLAWLLALTPLILISGVNRKWGVSDYIFAFSDEVVNDAAAFMIQMPIFVLCAELCPVGVEGSIFALTTTVNNVGVTVAGALGGALTSAFGVTLTDFSNLGALCALTACASLLPLLLLPLVRGGDDAQPPLPRRKATTFLLNGDDGAGDVDDGDNDFEMMRTKREAADAEQAGLFRSFQRGEIVMYATGFASSSSSSYKDEQEKEQENENEKKGGVVAAGREEKNKCKVGVGGKWVEATVIAVHQDDYTIRYSRAEAEEEAAEEGDTTSEGDDAAVDFSGIPFPPNRDCRERQTVKGRLRRRTEREIESKRRSPRGGALLLSVVGAGLTYSILSALVAIAGATLRK